jgi:hypothetical protein
MDLTVIQTILTTLGIDLKNLGINTGVIAGIIMLTKAIRLTKLGTKLGDWIVLMPIILGAASAFIFTQPLVLGPVFTSTLWYSGLSTLIFKLWKTARKK